MKCSKIKFANRRELTKKSQMRMCSKLSDTTYLTTDYFGYSFKLQRKKSACPQQQPPVSVKTLVLPENFAFNTGSSLERWSKKTPRLTSAKRSSSKSLNEFYDVDYDITIDVDDILNNVEDDDNNNLTEIDADYEVSSDIEELLLKTERERQMAEEEAERQAQNGKKRAKSEDRTKKKVKKHLKKSIRFSLSKPASPETEQVIRVDVTSTVPIHELRRTELRRAGPAADQERIQPQDEMINDLRKESKRTFNDNDVIKFDGEEEDFIVRCRQLALTQKRR